MSQVDFYILSQPEEQQRQFFACRLIEKAINQGLKIYLHTDSEQVAQEMDDLLWSFKPDSFIPHTIVGMEGAIDEAADDEDILVFIGYGDNYTDKGQLLVNLSAGIPEFHASFERVAEIVPNREEAKAISREHWNEYKAAGLELKHHQL